METSQARGQALAAHLHSPEGRKLFQALQIITGAMLLGALIAGLAFGLIIGLGAENAPTQPQPGNAIQPDDTDPSSFPILGLVSLVAGLGGAIVGIILLGQVRARNRSILNDGPAPFHPQSMLQATLTGCVVASALLEGPTLLAFLLAMVGNSVDRTLCLGVASALLVWWVLNLPTRPRFASLLGLEPDTQSP